MSNKKFTNVYDDGNIPDVDLPQNNVNKINDSEKSKYNEEPLSKSATFEKENPRDTN